MAKYCYHDEAQQQLHVANEQDQLLAENAGRHDGLMNEYGRLKRENEELIRTLQHGDRNFNLQLDGALSESIHQLNERNSILLATNRTTIAGLQATIAELQIEIAGLRAAKLTQPNLSI